MIIRACAVVAVAAAVVSVRADLVSTNATVYNNGELGHKPYQQYHTVDQFGPVLQVNTFDAGAGAGTGSHIFLRHDGHGMHDGQAVQAVPDIPGIRNLQDLHDLPNLLDRHDDHSLRNAHGNVHGGKHGDAHSAAAARAALSSPLVLDARDLSVVYVNRSFPNVFGTRVQEDRGRRYLTFWQGRNIGGFGDGFGLAYDEHYRLAYNVSAHNPNHVDLHEFALTGHGTALVAAVQWLPAQGLAWPSVAGAASAGDDQVLDSRFQEIDLDTNAVLFDWRASDHIDPAMSMEGRSRRWDAYHLNSIEKTRAGHYLLSLRHLHAVMLVHGRTGAVLWTFGGKMNVFAERPPPVGVTASRPLVGHVRWQHHVRFVPGTNESEITLFDNYVKSTSHGRCVKDCSRGLHIAIDTAAATAAALAASSSSDTDTAARVSNPRDAPTVQLLGEYIHPARLQAQSQGSVQLLPNGHVFIGWGRSPGFTEHAVAASGAGAPAMLDVQFAPWRGRAIGDSLDNYRAYKMDWVATPYWDPVLVLNNHDDGSLAAVVSWNGATEVRAWTVRAGGAEDRPDGGTHSRSDKDTQPGTVLARAPRAGFETTLELARPRLRYIWAEALDADGRVLRTSPVLDLKIDPATEAFMLLGGSIATTIFMTIVVGAGLWIRRRRARTSAPYANADADAGLLLKSFISDNDDERASIDAADDKDNKNVEHGTYADNTHSDEVAHLTGTTPGYHQVPATDRSP